MPHVKSSELSGPIILYKFESNRPKLYCYFRVAADIYRNFDCIYVLTQQIKAD